MASAIVRACDVDLGVRQLAGQCRPLRHASSAIRTASPNTATKLYETRDLLRRGAKEIGVTIAVSKLLSREFQYVQTELLQLAEICHKESALLSVVFETSSSTASW